MDQDSEEDIDWLETLGPDWLSVDFPRKYYAAALISDRYANSRPDDHTMRPGYKPGIKEIGELEVSAEDLLPFLDIKKKYASKFYGELSDKIGAENLRLYREALLDWQDGIRNHSEKIKRLKKSVFEYLRSSAQPIWCNEYLPADTPPLLSISVTKTIIDLHSAIFEEVLDDAHYKVQRLNTNLKYGYIHRGMNVKDLAIIRKYYENKWPYCEKSFLSSYSYSIHVAEQFAEIVRSSEGVSVNKAIVSSLYDNFYLRTIGSSMLNEELNIKQFELLSIPSISRLHLNYEGFNDGMHDFLLSEEYKAYTGGGYLKELQDYDP